MALHHIEPDARTIHGAFSRDLDPILTIDSGDTVRFRTLDSDWNVAPRTSIRHDEPPAQFPHRPDGQDVGHPLCGPVAIRGTGNWRAFRITSPHRFPVWCSGTSTSRHGVMSFGTC